VAACRRTHQRPERGKCFEPVAPTAATNPPQAACKRFHEHCAARGRALPAGRDGYALSYATNIPRQAGLSGSSAIACAALNCLFSHYGVPLDVSDRGGRHQGNWSMWELSAMAEGWGY
jgi:galactokinase